MPRQWPPGIARRTTHPNRLWARERAPACGSQPRKSRQGSPCRIRLPNRVGDRPCDHWRSGAVLRLDLRAKGLPLSGWLGHDLLRMADTFGSFRRAGPHRDDPSRHPPAARRAVADHRPERVDLSGGHLLDHGGLGGRGSGSDARAGPGDGTPVDASGRADHVAGLRVERDDERACRQRRQRRPHSLGLVRGDLVCETRAGGGGGRRGPLALLRPGDGDLLVGARLFDLGLAGVRSGHHG